MNWEKLRNVGIATFWGGLGAITAVAVVGAVQWVRAKLA